MKVCREKQSTITGRQKWPFKKITRLKSKNVERRREPKTERRKKERKSTLKKGQKQFKESER